MSAIRDGGKVKARERIAVLAALNLAYALAGRPATRTPPPPPPPSASPGPSAATSGAVDIDALVHRLDQVLGANGQLL